MAPNAARLPSRINASGDPVPLFEQDRSRWDRRLIEAGLGLLTVASEGAEASAYHLEAAVAAAHARAESAEETDWTRIVWLYDMLMVIRPGPVVALNRAIAIAQKDGPEQGLSAIRAIEEAERLAAYPFLPAALGELELRRGDRATAREHFRDALFWRAARPSGGSTPSGWPFATIRGRRGRGEHRAYPDEANPAHGPRLFGGGRRPSLLVTAGKTAKSAKRGRFGRVFSANILAIQMLVPKSAEQAEQRRNSG